MKRKPTETPVSEGTTEIVAPAILENAKRSLHADRPGGTAKCVVCNSDATPNPVEQLCWVCRRLKISAWRDADNQLSAQE
jgi:hypothetical protein